MMLSPILIKKQVKSTNCKTWNSRIWTTPNNYLPCGGPGVCQHVLQG